MRKSFLYLINYVAGFVVTLVLNTSLIAQWETITTVGAFEDLHCVYFLTPDLGWVGGDNDIVYKTTDGGDSWSSSNVSLNSNLTVYDIYFTNPDSGWAVMAPTNESANKGKLFFSSDGGATWTQLYTTLDYRLNALAIYEDTFDDDPPGWAVGGFDLDALVLGTDDGANWGIEIDAGGGCGGVFPPHLRGVSAPHAANAWFVGDHGIILKAEETTPLDHCFEIEATVPPITDHLYDVDMVNTSGHGFAVGGEGKGVILHRSGSSTWEVQVDGVAGLDSIPELYALSFANEDSGWAVGHGGTIVTTRDGGENWSIELEFQTTDTTLYDVFFVNDTTGFAVGDHGTVLAYNRPPVNIDIRFLDGAFVPSRIFDYELTVTNNLSSPLVFDVWIIFQGANGTQDTLLVWNDTSYVGQQTTIDTFTYHADYNVPADTILLAAYAGHPLSLHTWVESACQQALLNAITTGDAMIMEEQLGCGDLLEYEITICNETEEPLADTKVNTYIQFLENIELRHSVWESEEFTLPVTCTTFTRTFELPAYWPDGTYNLVISDGGEDECTFSITFNKTEPCSTGITTTLNLGILSVDHIPWRFRFEPEEFTPQIDMWVELVASDGSPVALKKKILQNIDPEGTIESAAFVPEDFFQALTPGQYAIFAYSGDWPSNANSIQFLSFEYDPSVLPLAAVENSRVQNLDKKETLNTLRSFPNPFNSEITFEFDIEVDSKVVLEIYNILGQSVAKLGGSTMSSGAHSIRWNGTMHSGTPASSGIYLYKLTIQNSVRGDEFYSGKILLQK